MGHRSSDLIVTSEALLERRDGMVRLVELLGITRHLQPFAVTLMRLLDSYQNEAWIAEGEYDGSDHDLSNTFADLVHELNCRWHPVFIVRNAMKSVDR